MMRFRVIEKYKSISKISEIELPSFTIITGLNGSGKSNFLEGIANHKIVELIEMQDPSGKIHLVTMQSDNVALYNNSSLSPATGQIADHRILTQNTTNAPQYYYDKLNTYAGKFSSLKKFAHPGLISHPIFSQIYSFLMTRQSSVSHEMLQKLFIDFAETEKLTSEIKKLEEEFLNEFNEGQKELILKAQDANKRISPFLLLEADFFKLSFLKNLPTEPFSHNLSILFTFYRNKQRNNEALLYRKDKFGEENGALDEKRFRDLYGNPPWEILDNLMELMELNFEFQIPNRDDDDFTIPKLLTKDTKELIDIESISSGEKILLSFVFFMYNFNDNKNISYNNKIILLDEIDASLHPRMSYILLKIIKKELIEKNNIRVIMTTHSPSTVALADEKSLFVMNKATHDISKTSKETALNALTYGVPTLAINAEGRRQVFVESNSDMELYQILFMALKEELKTEISLEFITAARYENYDDKKQEKDGGCVKVKNIVSKLVTNGNNSVFGLIDYDLKNKQDIENRIYVNSENKRYSIENIILDPLLIACLILKYTPGDIATIGISDKISYDSIKILSSDKLFDIAKSISSFIFSSNSTELEEVEYLGGIQIQIDRRFITTRGHDLEKLVISKINTIEHFKNYYQKEGEIIKHIVKDIVSEDPYFLPYDVFDSFKTICDVEMH